MKAEDLRAIQAPIKQRYRDDATTALIPARAEGILEMDAKYDSKSTDPQGGWGRLVLGETWVSHYAKNLVESTRCDVVPAAASHAIFQGVRPSFWLPDDGANI